MHTTEEAKELWCPMVRIGFQQKGVSATVNDPSSIPDAQGKCIANKCMMWRWHDEEGELLEKDSDSEPDLILRKIDYKIVLAKGYCGFAGI